MLGQLICGSVSWQLSQMFLLLSDLIRTHRFCIVCSRLLMWVDAGGGGRCLHRTVKHPIIVLPLPKPPPRDSDPRPTADTCNHHLNLLVAMQIL